MEAKDRHSVQDLGRTAGSYEFGNGSIRQSTNFRLMLAPRIPECRQDAHACSR